MKQIYSIPCLLGTIAVLTLTSCISSSAVTKPLASEVQGASATQGLLSPEQIAQLARLNVDVVLPTYLPLGFQVANFKSYRQQNPNDKTDNSYYTVSYRGTNNTCIEVGSGYQALWINSPTTTQVETPVGVAKVFSGKYRHTETLQHWAEIGQSNSGRAIFTGGRVAAQSCNSVSFAEYTKVLQSLKRLKPIAFQPTGFTTSELSPARSGGLKTAQQATLKALGIPVVVPAYVPQQFQVSKVIANSCRSEGSRTGACREGPNYTIVYRNPRNTCLVVNAIGGGVGGGAGEFEFHTQSALLGDVTILFGSLGQGRYQNQAPTPEQLQALQPNLSSFPATLKSGSRRSPFYSVVVGESNYYQTNYQCGKNVSITPVELEKVVQSLVLLK